MNPTRRALLALGCVMPWCASAAPQPRRLVFWRERPKSGRGDENIRKALAGFGVADGELDVQLVFTDGRFDLIDEQAQAILALRPDVVFTAFSFRVKALQRLTPTVPIVFFLAADPLEAGIVESYARPGRNATGAALLYRETTAKRLELARELLPRARRVAIVADYAMVGSTSPGFFGYLDEQARRLGIELVRGDVARGRLEEGLGAVVAKRPDAIVPVGRVEGGASLMQRYRELQSRDRIALIGGEPDEGGVLSYGPDMADHQHRAAEVLAKVVKGAAPSDVPVDRATRFLLVVRRDVATQMGIDVPASLRLRADRLEG